MLLKQTKKIINNNNRRRSLIHLLGAETAQCLKINISCLTLEEFSIKRFWKLLISPGFRSSQSISFSQWPHWALDGSSLRGGLKHKENYIIIVVINTIALKLIMFKFKHYYYYLKHSDLLLRKKIVLVCSGLCHKNGIANCYPPGQPHLPRAVHIMISTDTSVKHKNKHQGQRPLHNSKALICVVNFS